MHAGFALDGQTVGPSDTVDVIELPATQVASLVHRGSMDQVGPVYEVLLRWIDDSGYRLAGPSRELDLEWHDDHSRNVTEIQVAVET